MFFRCCRCCNTWDYVARLQALLNSRQNSVYLLKEDFKWKTWKREEQFTCRKFQLCYFIYQAISWKTIWFFIELLTKILFSNHQGSNINVALFHLAHKPHKWNIKLFNKKFPILVDPHVYFFTLREQQNDAISQFCKNSGQLEKEINKVQWDFLSRNNGIRQPQ